MKKITLLAFYFFYAVLVANAQNLVESYRSIQNWTHEGANNTITIQNDKLNFVQTHSSTDDERLHRPLGFALSDTEWTMEFEFTPTAGAQTGVAHLIASLTENTNDPITTAYSEQPIYTANSLISVYYYNEFGTPESNYSIRIVTKSDNSAYIMHPPVLICPPNHTYYIRVARVSADMGFLSVYSDAARTQHLSGSPACFAIDARIKGLQYLQHGVWLLGHPDRALSATLDNMQISNQKTPATTNVLKPTISGNPFLCAGGSATLTAYQPSYSSYVWSDGSTSAILNPTQAGVYTVTVTTAGNCGSGTNEVKVEAVNAPNVRISGAKTACEGSLTQLVAHDDAEVRPHSTKYTWQNGIQNDTLQAAAGKYSVTATNIHGCSVVVEQTIVGSEAVIVPMLGIKGRTISVHGAQPNYTYQWQQNGKDIPTATELKYKIKTNDFYRVCAKNAAGCAVCGGAVWLER